jgi:PPOX class probable F420-dependent enzyme
LSLAATSGRSDPKTLDYEPNRKENVFKMTPELERAVKRYRQWFGSYKKSGELVKVQVWFTVNNGSIEFLTLDDSYKVKRIRRNPRVICYIGDKEGPSVSGTAEIFMGRDAIWRVYRAYWKTHPLIMAFIAFPTKRRIRSHKEVLIRVCPNVPNPLASVTDPVV